jgi:Restriction endonuclease
MTPEAYIAAVKACPRVAWIENNPKKLIHGYVIQRNYEQLLTVSDSELSNRDFVHSYARKSTDAGNLSANTADGYRYSESHFFGELPPKEQLRAYFVSKHGKPRGFSNWLFPQRILNDAATEWVEEQIKKQEAESAAAREINYRKRIAAEKAAHEAQMRKRSYWEFLDGYAFERATAEVLKRHQFNPIVTPGSADGGIDIEVTRNGLRGVVQCKAHINCVGPSVVRDLYGVIHHCGAAFGIVVSRGGFTRGAADFARDKPILFLDTDDLIAMQEGRDVLAKAFAAPSSQR